MPATLDDRALNRALLARQHLLERTAEPLVDVVEAIGAMQGQAWGALPVGLWSRLASFAPADLYRALELGELRWGIGIRGTLHLVSAVEHPVYAVVSEAGWTGTWHRAIEETTPGMYALRFALLEHAATPRTNEELRAFAEAWVAEHPGEIDPRELDAQRALSWRPIYRWSALTRVPNGGVWGSKAPADHLAAPVPPGSEGAPRLEEALEALALRHLGAFGPAAAEDVATWVGWRTPPVRELLDGLGGRLRRFEDVHGRTLYDLRGRPAAGCRHARAAALPRRVRQLAAGLREQAPRAHRPGGAARRRVRAQEPAGEAGVPRRRARGGHLVVGGEAQAGDADAPAGREAREARPRGPGGGGRGPPARPLPGGDRPPGRGVLTLDGSLGEGGGQIVRTALALSLVTGTPFAVERIRAGRARPGWPRSTSPRCGRRGPSGPPSWTVPRSAPSP